MSEEMRFGFQLLKQKIQTQFNATASFNGIFLMSYVLLCMIMNLKEYEYTYLHISLLKFSKMKKIYLCTDIISILMYLSR